MRLPKPNSQAKDLSAALLGNIITEIKANGPLSFARYMEKVLYEPQLGYYQSDLQKFGSGGDFVTAPEISSLFSRALAVQCQEILQSFDSASILEIGAGSGQMALDILNTLSLKQQLPQRYYILEISEALKERQKTLFAHQAPEFLPLLTWLDDWPTDFIGVVLTNEVLDAIPVERFQKQEDFKQSFIDVTNKDLYEIWQTPTHELSNVLEVLPFDFTRGYTSEINLRIPAWLTHLFATLSKGVVLLLDYGFPAAEYYHPDRSSGTLMCHYQHCAHSDFFWYPGLQDMTAHVNFSWVAEKAFCAGFNIAGFTHQAAFLTNLGILQMLQELSSYGDYKTNQALKRLLMPSEMGELFKVLALTKNYSAPLLGFTSLNQIHRL